MALKHMANIIVYTKTGCPWRKNVLDFLNAQKIQFEERDMLKNEKYKKEAIEKSGRSVCPTLDIDGHILPDTDAKQVEEYLKSINVLN
jgi:glutaredoxin